MIKVSFAQVDRKRAASWFQAALLVLGMASFSYGMYIMFKPLGFLFGGVLLFGVGLLLNKVMENK